MLGNIINPFHIETSLPEISSDTPFDHSRAITWNVTLHFVEENGNNDTVTFGEAPDANNGPPADSYDQAKPTAPAKPYVYAWFEDGLPAPYDKLAADYRSYPDTTKTWNLSIHWAPLTVLKPTKVTISWNTSDINSSEYQEITLCDNGGAPLVNMKLIQNYTVTIPSNQTKYYHISCSTNTSNLPPLANFTVTPGNHTRLDSITFNDSSIDVDGSISNWIWNFDDGTIAYTQDVIHNYTYAHEYTINLTVTDNDNATSTKLAMLPIYYNLSIINKWNLFSIPFNHSINKSDIIVRWNNTDLTWEAAVAGGIIIDYFYGWNDTTQQYELNTEFQPQTAYWIWAYYDCSFLLTNQNNTDHYLTHLNTSWTLIGNPTQNIVPLSTIQILYNTTYYSWQNATSNNNELGTSLLLNFLYLWDKTSQGYSPHDYLTPGEGFWTYCYYPCTLYRPNS